MREPMGRERQTQVNLIVGRDKAAFDDWINATKPERDAIVPQRALRFLIPVPALQLAQDPFRVDVFAAQPYLSPVNQVRFVVFERRNDPLSDPAKLKAYIAGQQAYYERLSILSLEEGSRETRPQIPLEVDPQHVRNCDLIGSGLLKVHDFITNNIFLASIGRQLRVEGYDDRPELHGFGFATSFYAKLRHAAKAMKYRFITGVNVEPGYFVEKLGRSTLRQVKPELRKEFVRGPEAINQDKFTINFLYLEDREKYLI